MSSSVQQTSTLQQALRQVTDTREYQQLLAQVRANARERARDLDKRPLGRLVTRARRCGFTTRHRQDVRRRVANDARSRTVGTGPEILVLRALGQGKRCE